MDDTDRPGPEPETEAPEGADSAPEGADSAPEGADSAPERNDDLDDADLDPRGLADARGLSDTLGVDLDEAPGAEPDDAEDPAIARRIARLHLRGGAYALARVELETLAGAGSLDDEALLDLAEIRWRTEDLAGAGEAAAAVLASGRESTVALVIAAEATAALGRNAEARRLAERALELASGDLDQVFAGIVGGSMWPRAAALPAGATRATPPPATTVPATPPRPETAPIWRPAEVEPPAAGSTIADRAGSAPAPVRPQDIAPSGSAPAPEAARELAAAKAALAGGARADAAIRLAVVLRLSPALAPAVLELAATEPGPAFDLLRGDALRIVGHESEARRAYLSAASRLSAGAPAVDSAVDQADLDPEARGGQPG